MLLIRVLNTAILQVLVKASLVNGVHWAQAHRHRRELPEVLHTVWVRVRRQTTLRTRMLLTETIQIILSQTTLQERTRVHARGSMTLVENLVAALLSVLAVEEVIKTNLIQRRRRRIRGNMAANLHTRTLRAVHHDRRVPTHPTAVALLNLLITRELRLHLRRNRIHEIRRRQRRQIHPLRRRPLQQAQHQKSSTLRRGLVQNPIKRVNPFLGLFRVRIMQIRSDTLADQRDVGVIIVFSQGTSS